MAVHSRGAACCIYLQLKDLLVPGDKNKVPDLILFPLKAEEGLKEAPFVLSRGLPCRTLRVKALPNRSDINQSKPLQARVQ